MHHTCRFRGHQRFIVNHRKQVGFRNLRFQHRRGDLQQGLFGKDQRAFFHRAHVSMEPKFPQIIEELRRDRMERRMLAQKTHIVFREMQVFKKGEGRIQTCRHQVRARRREVAHEQFESRAAIDAVLEIRRGHRQFVQVNQ